MELGHDRQSFLNTQIILPLIGTASLVLRISRATRMRVPGRVKHLAASWVSLSGTEMGIMDPWEMLL